MTNPFSDLVPIGLLPLGDAADRLEALGDRPSSELVRGALSSQGAQRRLTGGAQRSTLSSLLGRDKKWAHTAHTVGFIKALPLADQILPIVHAGSMECDSSLLGQPLRVSLNALRIASYPGFGSHNVLLDFYVQNQAGEALEHLHFNAIYRGAEGEHAAVIGQTIFNGAIAGGNGLGMRCLTVNVKNEGDEKLLSFLDRDTFKLGLKLLKAAQPAIAPLSEMAIGLVTGLAKRAENVPVQDIFIGLDFGTSAGGARLACGTYVAVQIPEKQHIAWNWKDWVFDRSSGRVVLKSDLNTLVPYNYIAIGLELCSDSDTRSRP